MLTILSDHDVEGQVHLLLSIWTSREWIDFWTGLDCRVETFASLQLPVNLSDSELWQFCQDRQIVIVTGNRNADDESSLETTSRRRNQPSSLPIVTIGDSDRVMIDRQYAAGGASGILQILMELDQLRGTRRLFVP